MSDAPALPQGLPVIVEDDPWLGAPIHNPPGLGQIGFRIAGYEAFAGEMLRRLPGMAVSDPTAPGGVGYPLRDVHVDETPAWIPALVRSWAQVGDILTFYQERIANEGYVQTALESVSVDALHAEVGIRRGSSPPPLQGPAPMDSVSYRVDPGVAASAALAFTVVEDPNGPIAVPIPQGSPVRSHSSNAGATQTFETSYDFTARLAWNAMSLRPATPPPAPPFQTDTLGLTLAGTQTGLRAGARLLVLGAPAAGAGQAWAWRTVATVEPNRTLGTTLVTLAAGGAGHGMPIEAPEVFAFTRTAPLFGHDALPFAQQPLAVQLANPTLLLGGAQLYSISDLGPIDGPLNASFPQAAVRDVELDADGVSYLATSAGIFAWQDGAWTAMNNGLSSRDAYSLALGEQGFLYAGTAGGGAFRTSSPASAWDTLPGGVYLDGKNPVKASLPRSVVRSIVSGFAQTKGPPEPLLTVALTDEGLWANSGLGWSSLYWVWAAPPQTTPRFGAVAQLGSFVFAASQEALHLVSVSNTPPPGGAAAVVWWCGSPLGSVGLATYGEAGGWVQVMLVFEGAPKLATFLFPLVVSSAEQAPPPPPSTPPSLTSQRQGDVLEDWNLATTGLPHVDTGQMLAICGAPGPLGFVSGAPRFFGVWTDGLPNGATGLYVNVYVVSGEEVFFGWTLLFTFSGGAPLALPPAWSLAAEGDRLLVVSPLSAQADWIDFRPAAGEVDVVANGYTVPPGSWLALEDPTATGAMVNAWPVTGSAAGQRTDFAVSDKVLGVTVAEGLDPTIDLPSFGLRTATAYLASRSLALAPPQISEVQAAGGDALALAGLVDAPATGQALAVSGRRLRARIARLGGVMAPAQIARTADILLADADVVCMARSSDGASLALGSPDPGALMLRWTDLGWGPTPAASGDPAEPLLALEAMPGLMVGATGRSVYVLPDGGDAWTDLSLGIAPTALAKDVHGRLWLADAEGRIWRSEDGTAWRQAGVPPAPFPVTALCITGTGELFVAAGGLLHHLAPGGDAWSDATDGLGALTVTALSAQPGGPALAGVDGTGVYAWTGSRWKRTFEDLPVGRIRALRCEPDGRVMAGGYGDGAYVGDGERWTPIPLGLSNVVSAFAAAPDGPPFVGLRRAALLATTPPAPSVELGYQPRGFAADPDGRLAACLDQGLITEALRRAIQEAGDSLGDRATVAAIGATGWAVLDGDDLKLLARRAGGLAMGVAPDPLIAGSAVADDGTCAFVLSDGRVGVTQVLPGDVIWRPASASDAVVSELSTLAGCASSQDRRSTVLSLTAPLANLYDAATVTVSANVVEATQGQTVQEVLGSGDATAALQQFKLAQPPLTFVSAPPPANAQSTLTVFVNGAPWQEVASLRRAGPSDQVYTAEITADGGAVITFGDGVHGARLPTGTNNVTAIYRSGMGPIDDTDAGVLTLLLQPPAGIASATNPVPITPGKPPESREAVMRRAPGRLRAAGRLITRDDYADFIAGCAGVGQAGAWELDAGGVRLLQMTIAGAGPTPLEPDDPLLAELEAEIAARAAVPPAPIDLQPADVITFDLRARLWTTAGADGPTVVAQATQAVLNAFSAATRELAQPVYAAEVTQVLQATPGVAGVALDALQLTGRTGGAAATLEARPGRWNAQTQTVEPAELLVARADGGIIAALADGSLPR